MGGTIDQYVAASDVVAVEVYPGRVLPIEYMDSRTSRCVVAVWTGVRDRR